jgi:hypothetical protein
MFPRIDNLRRYQIRLPNVSRKVSGIATFILVFYPQGMLSKNDNLRPLLLDVETARKSPRAAKLRKNNLIVLTTWNWLRTLESAAFWLREDVVKKMQQESWVMFHMANRQLDLAIRSASPSGLG